MFDIRETVAKQQQGEREWRGEEGAEYLDNKERSSGGGGRSRIS